MIMPRGQLLLMPANPVFLAVSLVAALALNMLPLGRTPWMPDLVMILLAFWGMHQPLRVGMGTFKEGVPGKNVYETALSILRDFQGLRGLDRARIRELLKVPGLGPAKVAQIKACLFYTSPSPRDS